MWKTHHPGPEPHNRLQKINSGFSHKIVMFHSYVKLPEGMFDILISLGWTHPAHPVLVNPSPVFPQNGGSRDPS